MEKFKCGHDKSAENVGLVNKNNPKAGTRCKICAKRKTKDAYLKTAEKQKAYSREYRKKHSEQYKEYLRKWHKQNPTKNAEYQRLTKYMITFQQFEEMLKKSNGCCYICGIEPKQLPNGNTGLQIDHDHNCCDGLRTCGKCTRGLLCFACNRMLGALEKRDIKKVLQYINYDASGDIGCQGK
jgi:hypothetical protein